MNKIEFTVEKIENGYLLRWLDGLVDQFSNVWFYKTSKALVEALELMLDLRLSTDKE